MRVTLYFAVAVLVTTVARVAYGQRPTLPAGFLLALLFVVLPFAAAFARATGWVQPRVLPRAAGAVGLVTAFVALWLYAPQRPWVLVVAAAGILVLARDAWRGPASAATLARSILAFTLGYAVVINLNYLVLELASHRLQDPALRLVDLALYRWVSGDAVSYEGLFPLWRAPFVVALLETAYLFFFVEIATVLILVSSSPEQSRAFTLKAFACYGTAVFVFALYPVVGPCIYFPDAISEGVLTNATVQLMAAMRLEYLAVVSAPGGELNGLGYFIGLPSTHVAIATLCQRSVPSGSVLFWALLAINVLLFASTFLLGYHYFIDAPAGIALAVIVDRVYERAAR